MIEKSLPKIFHLTFFCALIFLTLLNCASSQQTQQMTTEAAFSDQVNSTQPNKTTEKQLTNQNSTSAPFEEITSYDTNDVINYDMDYSMTSQYSEEGSSEFDEVVTSQQEGSLFL